MNDIFTSGLGGMSVTRSAFGSADLAVGAQIGRDKTFAQKLKAAEEKAQASTAQANKTNLSPEDDKKLREVCREMESVFLNMLLSKMRETVPERTLFPKSSGEKIMQSMLDVELTRSMAGGGGIGLGEMLYRQLSQPLSYEIKETAKK